MLFSCVYPDPHPRAPPTANRRARRSPRPPGVFSPFNCQLSTVNLFSATLCVSARLCDNRFLSFLPVSFPAFTPKSPQAVYCLTHSDATLTSHPTSVASKGFTKNLTPLEATLTKNGGVGVSPAGTLSKWNSCSQPIHDSHDHFFPALTTCHSFASPAPTRSETRSGSLSPLESALTNSPLSNPFRIRTSIKNPGALLRAAMLLFSLPTVNSQLEAALPVLTPAAHCAPQLKVPECLS